MCIKHKTRNTFLSRHHILARTRKGKSLPSNCIKLWRDKHDAFHHIFHNHTFDEIMYDMHRYWVKHHETENWKILFRNLPLLEVVRLIERASKIKHSLKKRWH